MDFQGVVNVQMQPNLQELVNGGAARFPQLQLINKDTFAKLENYRKGHP
jgi:hypothetical protein